MSCSVVEVTVLPLGGTGCGIELTDGVAYSIGTQQIGVGYSSDCFSVVLVNGNVPPVIVNDGDIIELSFIPNVSCSIASVSEPICVEPLAECCGCTVYPFTWQLDVSDITDDCTDCEMLNGVHNLVLNDDCEWTETVTPGECGDTSWMLYCDEENMILQSIGSLVLPPFAHAFYTVPLENWNCNSTNVMDYVDGTGTLCTGWPDTITVNPVFSFGKKRKKKLSPAYQIKQENGKRKIILNKQALLNALRRKRR